jgi:hypothetical protein
MVEQHWLSLSATAALHATSAAAEASVYFPHLANAAGRPTALNQGGRMFAH